MTTAGSRPVDPAADGQPWCDADPLLLARRVRALGGGARRVFVGLTGGPGSGKSTVADSLAAALGSDAVVVPMDGFHLAQQVLRAHGTTDVKGAPQTFDADGYVALLERLRAGEPRTVYAPAFSRDLEEPIGSAIPVEPTVRYVLTEGNYLLLAAPPWRRIAEILDEIWYLDPGEEVRVNRLVRRHVAFGRAPVEALRRATTGSDSANATLIADTRPRANLVVRT